VHIYDESDNAGSGARAGLDCDWPVSKIFQLMCDGFRPKINTKYMNAKTPKESAMGTSIDVIRGTTQQIISRLYLLFFEQEQQDDTEYIRTVRTVVEAAVEYTAGLGEDAPVTQQLEKELFTFSRQIWLEHLLEKREQEGLSHDEEQAAYYTYYYRYIYENDQYPR